MNILFYWYHIVIIALGGGAVYATGEYRKPLSDSEFSRQTDVRWTIAGQDSLSSCYAWAMADEGYLFEGFYADSLGTQLLSDEAEQARLWAISTVAQQENGIVSGNDFYPVAPTDTIYALFRSASQPTALEATPATQSHSTQEQPRTARKELHRGHLRLRTPRAHFAPTGQRL